MPWCYQATCTLLAHVTRLAKTSKALNLQDSSGTVSGARLRCMSAVVDIDAPACTKALLIVFTAVQPPFETDMV